MGRAATITLIVDDAGGFEGVVKTAGGGPEYGFGVPLLTNPASSTSSTVKSALITA